MGCWGDMVVECGCCVVLEDVGDCVEPWVLMGEVVGYKEWDSCDL